MELKVLGSSSRGNCYILESETEALILDAGVGMQQVKQKLNFNISKVVGVCVSHSHLDHSKYIANYCSYGLKVYSNFHEMDQFAHKNHLKAESSFSCGSFKIKSFELKHDVPCLGFFIWHPESGSILYITDSYYVTQTFSGLNQILCEVNYDEEILDSRTGLHPSVRNRVLQSHMSLTTFKSFIEANDISKVRNIVLLHLSSGNSDAKMFQKEIELKTGKDVFVADSNMSINLNLNPF